MSNSNTIFIIYTDEQLLALELCMEVLGLHFSMRALVIYVYFLFGCVI